MERVFYLVEVVRSFGGVFTVLFHNTIYDDFDFKGWGLIYENFVRHAIGLGAFVGNCEQVLNLFENE